MNGMSMYGMRMHNIRSYVLDVPKVKDLRTGKETSDVKRVLDGHIDDFLIASLLLGVTRLDSFSSSVPRAE